MCVDMASVLSEGENLCLVHVLIKWREGGREGRRLYF